MVQYCGSWKISWIEIPAEIKARERRRKKICLPAGTVRCCAIQFVVPCMLKSMIPLASRCLRVKGASSGVSRAEEWELWKTLGVEAQGQQPAGPASSRAPLYRPVYAPNLLSTCFVVLSRVELARGNPNPPNPPKGFLWCRALLIGLVPGVPERKLPSIFSSVGAPWSGLASCASAPPDSARGKRDARYGGKMVESVKGFKSSSFPSRLSFSSPHSPHHIPFFG